MTKKRSALKAVLFSLLLLSSIAYQQVSLAADAIDLTALPMNGLEQGLINAFPTLLAADNAFQFNALIELPDTVVLIWTIEDGYYLYQKSLTFNETSATSIINSAPFIPPGEEITDEFFGTVSVYYDQLIIRLPFATDTAVNEVTLQLSYQGCAEAGFCYPVQEKQITLKVH